MRGWSHRELEWLVARCQGYWLAYCKGERRFVDERWSGTGLLEGGRKGLHGDKTLLGIFCKGFEYNLFKRWWDVWIFLPQRWRSSKLVLHGNFERASLKGALTAQPFIDDHSQSILIARGAWFALALLRSHIG